MRTNLINSILLTTSSSLLAFGAEKPNVIVIVSDQQTYSNMSCMGNAYINTPNIDKLANSGTRFAHCYSSNPVSLPARTSLVTGFYPSKVFKRKNDTNITSIEKSAYDSITSLSVASQFNKGGYDTFFGGKVHLPGTTENSGAEKYGFTTIFSNDEHGELTIDANKIIAARKSTDKPMLMYVNYINPHNICEYATYLSKGFPITPSVDDYYPMKFFKQADSLIAIDSNHFYNVLCPPIPANNALTTGATIKQGLGLYPTMNNVTYTTNDWKKRNWVYNRLVEVVDNELGMMLSQLELSEIGKNTIVVFTSDHGDMQGSHGLINKPFPYDECSRVPFVFSGGSISKNRQIDSLLVSGIDLVPTLCDFAGLPLEKDWPGISLKNILTDVNVITPRKQVFVEGANWTQIIDDDNYKFAKIENTESPSLFIDLQKDPGELINNLTNAVYAPVLSTLSTTLDERNKHFMREVIFNSNKAVITNPNSTFVDNFNQLPWHAGGIAESLVNAEDEPLLSNWTICESSLGVFDITSCSSHKTDAISPAGTTATPPGLYVVGNSTDTNRALAVRTNYQNKLYFLNGFSNNSGNSINKMSLSFQIQRWRNSSVVDMAENVGIYYVIADKLPSVAAPANTSLTASPGIAWSELGKIDFPMGSYSNSDLNKLVDGHASGNLFTGSFLNKSITFENSKNLWVLFYFRRNLGTTGSVLALDDVSMTFNGTIADVSYPQKPNCMVRYSNHNLIFSETVHDVVIRSVLGITIFEKFGKNTDSVSLSGLSMGIYLISYKDTLNREVTIKIQL